MTPENGPLLAEGDWKTSFWGSTLRFGGGNHYTAIFWQENIYWELPHQFHSSLQGVPLPVMIEVTTPISRVNNPSYAFKI